MQFFNNVGVTNSTVKGVTANSLNESLETMQAFFGLEVLSVYKHIKNVVNDQFCKPIIQTALITYHQVTGVLNNETIEAMKAPRCGVADISRYGHFEGSPKWKKQLITYRYLKKIQDVKVNSDLNDVP